MSVDAATLEAVGRRAGLCAVGFCRAEPFSDTAEILHSRKQEGLHGGMQFTYRNPDRSTDPQRLLPGAATLVVGALEFSAVASEPPADAGPCARVAAYARRDCYTPLREALEAVAQSLRASGHRAVVSADENGLVDRAAAHRSAIGWWGKNSNILVPGAGSLVVLGAVVTDASIVGADPEAVADGCGACRRCLDGCPTGAIVAPGTVDARRCLAWLVQTDGVFDPDYRVALGDRIYGCDDCADVCPPNRVTVRLKNRRGHRSGHRSEDAKTLPRSGRRDAAQRIDSASTPAPGAERPSGLTTNVDAIAEPLSEAVARAARERSEQERETQRREARRSRAIRACSMDGSWVPVLDLLEASDEELLAAYGRWYIPGREPRYLRRNALVVLANVGDRADRRVQAAVDHALRDPDALIRAHAVWCARRLGLGLQALHGGDDPLVRAELERAVPRRTAA